MWVRIQSHAISDCLARAASALSPPSWVLHIDVDEFLVPAVAGGDFEVGPGSMRRALEVGGGDEDSAVKIAWLQFSGRRTGGGGLTFEEYVWHENDYVGVWSRDGLNGKVKEFQTRHRPCSPVTLELIAIFLWTGRSSSLSRNSRQFWFPHCNISV